MAWLMDVRIFLLLVAAIIPLQTEALDPSVFRSQAPVECEPSASSSAPQPANQLLDHLNTLKNIMSSRGEASSVVFDAKQGICDVYSDSCSKEPVEKLATVPLPSQSNTQMVLFKHQGEETQGESQPQSKARVLDESFNFIEINPETNESMGVQLSETAKDILAKYSSGFESSGKTFKLKDVSEADRKNLIQELGVQSIIENKDTGETSIDLDYLFDADSKEPSLSKASSFEPTRQKEASSDSADANSKISSTPSPSDSRASLLDSMREKLCQQIESSFPKNSSAFLGCVKDGFIKNDSLKPKSLDAFNDLKASALKWSGDASEESARSSPPSNFPQTASVDQLASTNSSLKNSMSANFARFYNTRTLDTALQPQGSAANQGQGSSGAFNITDASAASAQGLRSLSASDKAQLALQGLADSILAKTAPSFSKISENSIDQQLSAGALVSTLAAEESAKAQRQFLASFDQFNDESRLSDSVSSSAADFEAPLPLESPWVEQTSSGRQPEALTDSDAQQTKEHSPKRSFPSGQDGIELPPFVLPERPRYAAPKSSDQPPQT